MLSEPGAVATGQTFKGQCQFIKYALDFGSSVRPVATAPGSDTVRGLVPLIFVQAAHMVICDQCKSLFLATTLFWQFLFITKKLQRPVCPDIARETRILFVCH